MPSAVERAGYERAIAAAEKGRIEATAPAKLGLAVDFVTLYHAACEPNVPWPKAVLAWADKTAANTYLLDRIEVATSHPTGGSPIVLLRLLDELLKAVNG